MVKNEFLRKKYWVVVLLIISIVLLLGFFKQRISSCEQEKTRANLLAEGYGQLDEQITHKAIKIGEPILLYDGTKFTVYNIQVYEPAQVSRNRGDSAKYIAIALDIEIDRERDRVMRYNPDTKSITFYTDKEAIDYSYAETIIDLQGGAYNPHSMKWTMQELRHELRLFFYDTTLTGLDPYYDRLAFDKEAAQPSISRLWNDYEKKSNGTTYIDAPRKLRGWVTWIFKVDESFINDKVDSSFTEGLVLHYKNASGNLTDFAEELGKIKK